MTSFIFIIAFFLLCFAYPTFRIYKKSGINPITFSKSQSAHDLIGFYMKILMIACFAGGLESLHLFDMSLDLLFSSTLIKHTGEVLMALSMIWVLTAQIQMSDSWRIGIDEKHKTTLRTNGLFGQSRNPIFLGMLVFQTGLFLEHPTMLFLSLAILSFVLITIQVRLEESFLTKVHGEDYILFLRTVPRWLIIKYKNR
jgi:protein-S-isoprenylcysteine O-methyltransferase Ste14